MNYDDFVSELTRTPTHASLSPSELESMGKRASQMYLCQDTPLTEAVVKLAQEYPGISRDQVKRVVEYANTSTFHHLFEKQAGDKNVEFDIADPHDVLRELNAGAAAPLMKVASADYASPPPAARGTNLAADLELCEVFGVTPEPTPAMQKTAGHNVAALAYPIGGALLGGTTGAVSGALMNPEDRERGVLVGGAGGALAGGLAGAGVAGGIASKVLPIKTHNALTLYAPLIAGSLAGGAYRSGSGAGLVTKEAMVPGAPEPMAPPPLPESPRLKAGLELLEQKANEAKTQAKLLQQKAQLAQPADMSQVQGMGKEASAYVQADRPGADLIQADLEKFASVENIRDTISKNSESYVEANPYGDLIRARQYLTKMAADAEDARDRNADMWKMATAELGHHVIQHLLNGGNMGEVAHAMEKVASPELVAKAVRDIAPAIEKRGFDLVELQSRLIMYEMEKGASVRVMNPENPITKTFAGWVKLAQHSAQLRKAHEEIQGQLSEANSLLSQAAKV